MSAMAERALLLLRQGDRAGALSALAEPGDADDHAARGAAHLDGADWEAARWHLLRACMLGDVSPATLLNLALAEDRLGLNGRARLVGMTREYPEWDEPPLRLAESLRRAGDTPDAIAAYELTLEINPDRREALLGLAVLCLGMGESARAQALLLRCCGVGRDDPQTWDALGVALTLNHELAMAESAFARAQELAPRHLGIALRRAAAAIAAGHGEREAARLELACPQDPLNLALLVARGVLLDRLGRSAEAAELLEAAVALAPECAPAAAALAVALLHAGRFVAAVPALRHAAALAPGDRALRNDLAAALNRIHRHAEAEPILRGLIAQHGEQVAFLSNLCNALVCLGRQEEGVEVARRATALAPEQCLGWRTLANALAYRVGAATNELRDAARRAALALPRPTDASRAAARDPDKRLRVGLLSASLRTHPVGWLTVAGIEALDPAQFELVCFGPPLSEDSLLRRFRAASSAWHEVTRMAPEAVAALIRREGVDVLIELGGWGEQGMLAVCAQRAAPVQIKWVGMQCASTGLPEMDWMLTDRWETPDGYERFYSERLLRLPDGYVCYSPSPLAPEVADAPALRRGRITFGCFNNLAKITPEALRCWAAILHELPQARLLLKAHQFSDAAVGEALRARFAALGVAADRILPHGSSGHRAQLALHAEIDLMLDPFPYSGGLSTCEALWMGVPVVTLPGETFASRHSASHLCNVGLPEFVARDATEYRRIALDWASDVARLQALRQGLRARMRASPLCDAPRFGRALGAALRQAWREACAA